MVRGLSILTVSVAASLAIAKPNVQVTVNVSNNTNAPSSTVSKPAPKKVVAKKSYRATRKPIRRTQKTKVASKKPVAMTPLYAAKPSAAPSPRPVVIERLPVPAEPVGANGLSTSSTGAGTTKTKLKTVKKEMESKWRFRYRTYNALNSSYIYGENPDADGEVYAWDRFDVSYAITEHFRAAIMPQFQHTWFGARERAQNPEISGLDQSYSGFMLNTALILSHSKIATLSGGIVMDGMLRYDIPTSEISQKSDTMGEAWAELGLGKEWKVYAIRGYVTGRYYLQQYETSTLVDAKTGKELQNRHYRVYTLLDQTVKFTEKFNFTLSAGFMNEGKYGDTRPGAERDPTQNDFIVFNPDLGYKFSKNFALNLGYFESGADMRKLDGEGWQPFSEKNGGEYYLMGTVIF